MKSFFKKVFSASFSYHQIFFLVLVIASLRVIADWSLLTYSIERSLFQDSARFWLENVYYFAIAFLFLCVVCSKITGIDLHRVMNFGIKAYPVIIFPPLVDFFLVHRIDGYTYGSVPNLFLNILTLGISSGETSFGISLEIFLAMVTVLIYVFVQTKNILKAVFFAVFLEVFFMVISTPDLFFGEGMGDYFFDFFLPLYYFIPFLVLLAAALFLYERKKLFAICRNLRLLRSTIFISTVFLGGIIRKLIYTSVYPLLLLWGSFAMFFAWQFSIVINDIYDVDIDRVCNRARPLARGDVSTQEYWFVASVFGLLALSFAILAGIKVLCLIATVLVLGVLYSVPPLRLRRNVLGNFVIGSALLIAFMVGVYSSGGRPVMIKQNVFLAGIIFLFGTALTLAKDIKDIEGDQKCGIKNLYTMYGKKKGKKIASFLIFFILSVPAVVFVNLSMLLFSILAVVLYYKFESIKSVYIFGVLITLLTVFNMYFIR